MHLSKDDFMIRVLFICHGNICRSPAAEYIFKELLRRNNISNYFEVSSAALSCEEEGNDIYAPMKDTLRKHNIPFERHRAHKFVASDYGRFDHIYVMDESNLRLIHNICEDYDHKIELLNGYIEDPWYTDNFEKVYEEIYEGCTKRLEELEND